MQSTRSSAGWRNAIRERRVEEPPLTTVRVVEWQFDRAVDALDALFVTCAEPVEGIEFNVHPDLIRSGSGGTSDEFSLALALAAVARSLSRADARTHLDEMLADVPEGDGLRAGATSTLQKFGQRECRRLRTQSALARRVVIDLSARNAARRATASTRLSFVTEGGKLTASAITDTATVPERLIGVDLALVGQAAARMTKPRTEDLASMASFMGQLVVPHDFRPLLRGSPRLVVEVDRTMALVHWEMLTADLGVRDTAMPLGLGGARWRANCGRPTAHPRGSEIGTQRSASRPRSGRSRGSRCRHGAGGGPPGSAHRCRTCSVSWASMWSS